MMNTRLTINIVLMLVTQAYCIPCILDAQRPVLRHEPYWITAMREERADYIRALQSFEDFWAGKIIPSERFDFQIEIKRKRSKKDKGDAHAASMEESELLMLRARQFRRWAWMNRSFFGKDGRLPSSKKWEEKARTRNQSRHQSIMASWTPAGPNSALMDPLPAESRIGRMVQVKFHPTNPNIVYAVSGSGGLFRSTDHGFTWNVLGTDALPFGYQPASVCIDYTDDQVLYLGMGDPNFGSQGHGVWKSTDGGSKWFNSSGQIGDRLVYDILMSPSNHSILNAAVDNGIWRSTESGEHWQQKISLVNDEILDIAYKPGSADTIYACSFSKFFRSVDDGESWQQITDGIETPAGGGRGMRLAVSAADPDVVYLGMFAHHGTLFKSTDGGTSFQKIYQDTVGQSLTTITGTISGSSNGQYNFSLAADPLDADIVYFGTQTLWKSTDGGVSWTSLYAYLYRVHPDIHDLEFSPLDHSLFNINDGGIAVSPDGGFIWDQRNDGIVAAEIYNGGQSPTRRDMMIIGTQDNGALGFLKSNWITIMHGDVYDQFWFDYHSSDRYYSDNGYSRGMESHKNYNLNWPLQVTGSRKMAFTPADSNVAFLSQNEVWRCMNINSSTPQWTKISDALSNGSGDYIRDLLVSPHDANEIYFVLGNSTILHSQNALADIPEYDTLTAPASSVYYQTSLAISRQHPDILYYTSWNRIFRSYDRGKTWADITGNLPKENIYKIIHDGFETNESIYVLCDNSVYYRNDSLGQWVEYAHGLPGLAYVSDLQVYNDGSNNSLIRAITYGRGVFETPLFKTRALPSCDFTADTTSICPDGKIIFTALTLDAESWHWEFEGGNPSTFDGPQPPSVAYAQPGYYTVSLTVNNSFGEVQAYKPAFIHVRQAFTLPLDEGFENQFPPEGFESNSLSPNNIRWNVGGIGGYELSDQCGVFIDHAPYSRAEIQWSADLSESIIAGLSFDIAYGRKAGSTAHDSLEVLVSEDCGKTFTTVFKLGGDLLATMPDIENVLTFNPGPDGWRTEQIDLSPFCGNRHLEISIQAFGGAGEVIALDNIALRSSSTPVDEVNYGDNGFELFPNPASGPVYIRMASQTEGLIHVTNAEGREIFQQHFYSGDNTLLIPAQEMGSGIYIVTLITEKGSSSRFLFVQ